MWLDVDLDNADVDWRSEGIFDDTSDSSDSVEESSSDELEDDDDAYLEEVRSVTVNVAGK